MTESDYSLNLKQLLFLLLSRRKSVYCLFNIKYLGTTKWFIAEISSVHHSSLRKAEVIYECFKEFSRVQINLFDLAKVRITHSRITDI